MINNERALAHVQAVDTANPSVAARPPWAGWGGPIPERSRPVFFRPVAISGDWATPLRPFSMPLPVASAPNSQFSKTPPFMAATTNPVFLALDPVTAGFLNGRGFPVLQKTAILRGVPPYSFGTYQTKASGPTGHAEARSAGCARGARSVVDPDELVTHFDPAPLAAWLSENDLSRGQRALAASSLNISGNRHDSCYLQMLLNACGTCLFKDWVGDPLKPSESMGCAGRAAKCKRVVRLRGGAPRGAG